MGCIQTKEAVCVSLIEKGSLDGIDNKKTEVATEVYTETTHR